jgi:nucleoside phosphorylase
LSPDSRTWGPPSGGPIRQKPDPTTTVAVVFALDAEWAPWRSRHAFHVVATGGPPVYEVYEGSVGQSRARVALSGVGAPETRRLIEALCTGRIDALLAVGLAGALRDPYVCSDVIVARRAQLVASGSLVASDARLVEIASQCGAKVIEVLLCADRTAGRVDEKRRLAAQGEAIDMESFRILEEAQRRGVPSVAIRVIGDSADEGLPLDFDQAVRADGTVNMMNLVGQAVRAPSRWSALVSFGSRQRRAVHALAGFLDRFVTNLGASIE